MGTDCEGSGHAGHGSEGGCEHALVESPPALQSAGFEQAVREALVRAILARKRPVGCEPRVREVERMESHRLQDSGHSTCKVLPSG